MFSLNENNKIVGVHNTIKFDKLRNIAIAKYKTTGYTYILRTWRINNFSDAYFYWSFTNETWSHGIMSDNLGFHYDTVEDAIKQALKTCSVWILDSKEFGNQLQCLLKD